MSISKKPTAGRVYNCEFSGAVDPEMNTPHLVVVVSGKRKNTMDTCLCIPFSSKTDHFGHQHHIEFNDGDYPFISMKCWAKPDLIKTTSFKRLTILPDRLGGEGAHISKAHLIEIVEKLKNYIHIS